MILCLDSGNTRLKWAIYSASGDCLAQGAVAHETWPQTAHDLRVHPVRKIMACNVAGVERHSLIAAAAEASFACAIEWIASAPAAAGVVNGYADYRQLGADRWLALIGARGITQGNALVIMAGTATTVDTLLAEGRFCGGIILPGVDMMLEALRLNTAQLPRAMGDYQHCPDNTDAAIMSGVLEAQAGAIERRFAQLADATALCLLGGGAAERIAPLLDLRVQRVNDLVLRGLARLAGVLP